MSAAVETKVVCADGDMDALALALAKLDDPRDIKGEIHTARDLTLEAKKILVDDSIEIEAGMKNPEWEDFKKRSEHMFFELVPDFMKKREAWQALVTEFIETTALAMDPAWVEVKKLSEKDFCGRMYHFMEKYDAWEANPAEVEAPALAEVLVAPAEEGAAAAKDE